MRVSYEWLKTLVDLPQDPKDLEREFVRTGTEIEAVERVGANLDHVVTAQVVSKEPHPDSDHMYVTLVDVGKNNVDKDVNPVPLQIVCGAQNFNQGDHIVTAMIGAVLPGDFKIKKSKLRGVESCGMNCSSRELGLGDDQSGIMILPEDAPIGVPFTDYLGMSDVVLDCEITPNRPDCLSMTGMAVEVSAIYDIDTHIELPSITSESGQNASDQVDVTVADPELCSRYTARVVRNVKIGPSPEWLARRVTACGGRSINNVVDVTNYVMYLTGQPLHAFDLGKLTKEDGKYHIVVRAAKDGEHIVTLDGEDRELTSDMTVITDNGKTPIALAGVMGGMDSEITENTVDVLLESAVFDNGHISRTSRNLDLMSEASIRYERLVDPNGCASVADIAAALFEKCCGAEVCPGIVDVYPKVKEAVTIALRPERVCALAGAQIPERFMVSRLARLGCKVTPADDGNLSVVAPTNRPDLTREVDLIEEIVRLWGEGDIEATLPAARNHAGGLTLEQRQIRKIGRTLRSLGLNETKSYLFASPDDLSKLGMSEEGRGIPVKVISPLVADQSEMRRSIVPGLLRSIAYNLAHGVFNIAMYELGRVLFGHKDKSQPDEPRYVCGVLVGRPADDTWNAKYLAYDFFDAKGIVEGLLEALRIPKVRFRVAEPEQYGWLQPGRAAEILAGSEPIGWAGNIHPLSLQNFDIEVPVIAFEISVASLLRLSQKDLPIVEPPTYPGISIDLAIVVDESVTAEQLVQRLKSAGGKLLCDIRLFDVYRDALRVGKGKKSMAFSLTYRADDRTLTSEEVEKTHAKLVEKVLRSTGGEIRG